MIERPKSAELCDMIAEQYTRAEFVLFNCVLKKLFLPLLGVVAVYNVVLL